MWGPDSPSLPAGTHAPRVDSASVLRTEGHSALPGVKQPRDRPAPSSDAREPLARGQCVLPARQRRPPVPSELSGHSPSEDVPAQGKSEGAEVPLTPAMCGQGPVTRALSLTAARDGLPATTLRRPRGDAHLPSRRRPCVPSEHGAWDSDRTTHSASARFSEGRDGNARLRAKGQSACLHCSHHAAALIVGFPGSGVQALGEFSEAVRRRREQRTPFQPSVGKAGRVLPRSRPAPATRTRPGHADTLRPRGHAPATRTRPGHAGAEQRCSHSVYGETFGYFQCGQRG